MTDEAKVDEALRSWRQGDAALDVGLEFLHLANLSLPLSAASRQAANAHADGGEKIPAEAVAICDEVRGVVMLSQTCDVVRSCRQRPFVEVAPLVEMLEREVEHVRRLKRPAFAYVTGTAKERLIADLDRIMTVEKTVVAGWARKPGWESDEDLRNFALAISRKWSRFAFPEDFVSAARALQKRIVEKHDKQTREGTHLQALREMRVRAAPSWNDDPVHLD